MPPEGLRAWERGEGRHHGEQFGGYVGENFFFSNEIAARPESRRLVFVPVWWEPTIGRGQAGRDLGRNNTMSHRRRSIGMPSGSRIVPDAADRGHMMVVPGNGSNLTGRPRAPRLSGQIRMAFPTLCTPCGLVIFNDSTGKLNYYDGKTWRELADAPATP
jgi:hypothetical protein